MERRPDPAPPSPVSMVLLCCASRDMDALLPVAAALQRQNIAGAVVGDIDTGLEALLDWLEHSERSLVVVGRSPHLPDATVVDLRRTIASPHRILEVPLASSTFNLSQRIIGAVRNLANASSGPRPPAVHGRRRAKSAGPRVSQGAPTNTRITQVGIPAVPQPGAHASSSADELEVTQPAEELATSAHPTSEATHEATVVTATEPTRLPIDSPPQLHARAMPRISADEVTPIVGAPIGAGHGRDHDADGETEATRPQTPRPQAPISPTRTGSTLVGAPQLDDARPRSGPMPIASASSRPATPKHATSAEASRYDPSRPPSLVSAKPRDRLQTGLQRLWGRLPGSARTRAIVLGGIPIALLGAWIVSEFLTEDGATPTAIVAENEPGTPREVIPTAQTAQTAHDLQEPAASRAQRQRDRVLEALRSRELLALDILLITQKTWIDMSYPEAQRHCEALVLAGLDDWRLPTIGELHALADARMLEEQIYWSSTAGDTFGDAHLAWDGRREGMVRLRETGTVLCVREHDDQF